MSISQPMIQPIPAKAGWFQRWKKARADKRHADWMAHFDTELAKIDSKLHQTVLVKAHAMARGMVMRHYDDAGIRRCALCISTDQLRRVIVGVRPKRRIYFLCNEHKDVRLPEPRPKAQEGLKAPAVATQANRPMSKLEPEHLQDILATYEKAKDKPLRDVHPVIPHPAPPLKTEDGSIDGR